MRLPPFLAVRLLPLVPLLIGLSVACAGPREESSKQPAGKQPAGKELTPEEFRELLAQGTITPVESMKEEDAFAGLEADMETETGAPVQPTPEPPPIQEAPAPVNPYLAFGERIKVNPDGTITKPYPLRVGTGKRLLDLIVSFGNFPMWEGGEEAGASTPDTVHVQNLEKWDIELYQNLRDPAKAAEERPLADWLVVTTGQDLLYEVEDFINLFAAGVPQIEIEAKIVEITFSKSLDIGVKPVDSETPIFQLPKSGIEDEPSTFVKGFSYGLPNLANANEALLTIGAVQDGITFGAILEAIAATDNVSIISRPKIAVREGGRADISNTERIPFLTPNKVSLVGAAEQQVEYQDVGIQLFVVPRVVGTETVALNIDVEASQQSGKEVLFVTSEGVPITAPRISQRSARTTVYLQPGQAVILGGLITERNTEQIQKVPFLGDIPLLNLLFRSKFTRKEETNVLFFIRPRILQGADLTREF
jgi:type II secretory pathway component GspD/PulD (secretin)